MALKSSKQRQMEAIEEYMAARYQVEATLAEIDAEVQTWHLGTPDRADAQNWKEIAFRLKTVLSLIDSANEAEGW